MKTQCSREPEDQSESEKKAKIIQMTKPKVNANQQILQQAKQHQPKQSHVTSANLSQSETLSPNQSNSNSNSTSTSNTNNNTKTNVNQSNQNKSLNSGGHSDAMSSRYKFHNDCQSSVLTYEQVKRLDFVMDQVVPIHGRGQFPTLYVKLRELIRLVKYKLQQEHSIEICDVRLNGGAASYVLAPDSSQYNDLDLIFGCDLSDESRFDVIRDTVLECLREFYPFGNLETNPPNATGSAASGEPTNPVGGCDVVAVAAAPGEESADAALALAETATDKKAAGQEDERREDEQRSGDVTGAASVSVAVGAAEAEKMEVKKCDATATTSTSTTSTPTISGRLAHQQQQQQQQMTNHYHHNQMPLSYCAIKEAYVHKMVKVNDDDRWSLISLGVQQSETTTTTNSNATTSTNQTTNTTTTTTTTETTATMAANLAQQQMHHNHHALHMHHYNHHQFAHNNSNNNSSSSNSNNNSHHHHHRPAPNNIELKFVDRMRRKFEFSVDSFQIILDSLLQFYDYAPSVAATNYSVASSANSTSSASSTSSSSGCVSSPASIINGGSGSSSSGSRSPLEVASSASSVVSSSSSSLSCDEDQEDLYCAVDGYEPTTIAATNTTSATATSSSSCSLTNTIDSDTNTTNSSTTSSLLSSANSILSTTNTTTSTNTMNSTNTNTTGSTCSSHSSVDSQCGSSIGLGVGAAAASISENFYPTVIGRSEYGMFKEALYHLERKLIATRSPEEIRGGGLLKYCNLLVKNYKPTNVYQIRTLERYMCSRFFIDFSDVSQQQAKLESYLANHFSDDPLLKFDYLTILYNVVNRSTVCLMNHELRLTLNMIRDLAFKLGVEQQQQLQQQQQHHQQQQQQQHYYYQPQRPVSIQSGVYRVKLVNYTLAKQQPVQAQPPVDHHHHHHHHQHHHHQPPRVTWLAVGGPAQAAVAGGDV